jgi:hypothetical protein
VDPLLPPGIHLGAAGCITGTPRVFVEPLDYVITTVSAGSLGHQITTTLRISVTASLYWVSSPSSATEGQIIPSTFICSIVHADMTPITTDSDTTVTLGIRGGYNGAKLTTTSPKEATAIGGTFKWTGVTISDAGYNYQMVATLSGTSMSSPPSTASTAFTVYKKESAKGCSSSVLDAGGVCCTSGILDSCGVCEGHDACSIGATLDLGVPAEYTMNELLDSTTDGYTNFVADFTQDIAAVLIIESTRVEVQSITEATEDLRRARRLSHRRRLSDVEAVTVDFRVLPDPAPSPLQTMQQLKLSLVAAVSNTASQLYTGGTVTSETVSTSLVVTREGVCGNEVCEVGEGYAKCPGDCHVKAVVTKPTSPAGLGGGIIAVIVIACVVGIALIAFLGWTMMKRAKANELKAARRKRVRKSKDDTDTRRQTIHAKEVINPLQQGSFEMKSLGPMRTGKI